MAKQYIGTVGETINKILAQTEPSEATNVPCYLIYTDPKSSQCMVMRCEVTQDDKVINSSTAEPLTDLLTSLITKANEHI